MSAVDVLAVMEQAKMAAEFSGDVETERERAEARAAVAELIEAAKWAERDEYTRPACVRLCTALARVGGAK